MISALEPGAPPAAVRTLGAFARHLHDDVGLDAPRSDVLQVIGDTLNPAHAGVWLRGEPQ